MNRKLTWKQAGKWYIKIWRQPIIFIKYNIIYNYKARRSWKRKIT